MLTLSPRENQLTCDPWEIPMDHELKKIVGNVGKPGITLLIPPFNHVGKTRDPSAWRLTSDSDFNRAAEDHFSRTSLHLSFTNYYMPLNQVGQMQGQDHHVFKRESVVSVYDSGEWIGDLDILKCLEDERLHRVYRRACSCRQSGPNNDVGDGDGAISVECWGDVLDPPSEQLVVRAHRNWVARLATVAMLVQTMPGGNEHGIALCPNDMCWFCHPYATSNSHLLRADLMLSTVRFPSIVRGMIY